MSKYIITKYSFDKAKQLNVIIKTSKNTLKKIDVYDLQGKFIASIGDSRYNDYGNYLKINGQIYANQRKKLYHNRHTKNANIKYSKQWLSLNLLW